MFLNVLATSWPIFAALVAGYGAAWLIPDRLRRFLVSHISRFICLLLLAIGFHFGSQIDGFAQASALILRGLAFAAAITACATAAVLILYRRSAASHEQQTTESHSFTHVVIECLVALLLVAAGVLLQRALQFWLKIDGSELDINFFLYILLFLIGLDISTMKLPVSSLSRRVLILPFVLMISSLAAGGLTAVLLGMRWQEGMLLAGGFGWFSLSGVLVGAQAGEQLGALIFMVDLFRELLSILVLYLLGRRHAHAAIAAAGATAMDTTLPIIKKVCGSHYVPAAIYSGLLISIATPFVLAFLLSLI